MSNLLVAALVVLVIAIAAFFALRKPNCKKNCPCPACSQANFVQLANGDVAIAANLVGVASTWWAQALINGGVGNTESDKVILAMNAFITTATVGPTSYFSSISDVNSGLSVLLPRLNRVVDVWNMELSNLPSEKVFEAVPTAQEFLGAITVSLTNLQSFQTEAGNLLDSD
jgi:hypothetical protein